MTVPWPHLTTEVAPFPGTIRTRPQDFEVDEVPAYEPCGVGDHLYARIEKVGVSTRQAVAELAQALGIPASTIGVAGQKDGRAVARQVVSLEHVAPERLARLHLPHVQVLDVARHRTKLRLGSLRANRFTILLRRTAPERVGELQALLGTLAGRGVPNYFGPQRFGARGETWAIGRALLAGDPAEAIALIVGAPDADDPPLVFRARQAFQARRYAEAAGAWPASFPEAARLCRALARSAEPALAIRTLDRRTLAFYVSAYQGWLFNHVLATRIKTLDRILPGEILHEHLTGRHYRVAEAVEEQPRAERFQVSPTGPILGDGMLEPEAEAGAIESGALEQAGRPVALPRSGPLRCIGGRRPLRFRPEDVAVEAGADDLGPHIRLVFTLPAGCYATAVLREICKDRLETGARRQPGALLE